MLLEKTQDHKDAGFSKINQKCNILPSIKNMSKIFKLHVSEC